MRELEHAGQLDEAKSAATKMYKWLSKTATQIPDDTVPQNELLQTQTQLTDLLASTGLKRESAELAQAVDALRKKLDERVRGNRSQLRRIQSTS